MANTVIPSELIADDAIATAKIADDAVNADKLASNAVVTASIVDDAVTGAKIENAVTIATSVTSPLVDGQNFKINGGQGTDGQLLTSTGSGVAWEDAPAGGPTFKTFGTSSIMVGDDATGTINAANYNTGLGVGVFAAAALLSGSLPHGPGTWGPRSAAISACLLAICCSAASLCSTAAPDPDADTDADPDGRGVLLATLLVPAAG